MAESFFYGQGAVIFIMIIKCGHLACALSLPKL